MAMRRASFEIALMKGEIGEDMVRPYLEGFGYIVYYPYTRGKPHYFDILATKGKKKVIAVDVKAKARFTNWPITGINECVWKQYSEFTATCKVPFKLVFVDEHPKEMRVYGQDLEVLGMPDRTMPDKYGKPLVLWKLSRFAPMFSLSAEQVEALQNISQRSYPYTTTDAPLFDSTEHQL